MENTQTNTALPTNVFRAGKSGRNTDVHLLTGIETFATSYGKKNHVIYM
jgi:hypothetical protein